MILAERLAELAVRMTEEDARGARRDLEVVQSAGITSLAQLVDALRDANTEPSVRAYACSLVASLRESSASAALAHALEHGKDDGLQWEAAKALVSLGAKDAAPALLRTLKQGTPAKQSAAAYALGWLGVANTIPSLRAAALNPKYEVDVRGHAAEAMGVMRARDAVPDLIALLSDASPELRYWACYSLGQIGDPASIPELERLAASEVAVLFHDRSVRHEALDAIENIREREQDQT